MEVTRGIRSFKLFPLPLDILLGNESLLHTVVRVAFLRNAKKGERTMDKGRLHVASRDGEAAHKG
jgi:hypothetical protein